MSWSSVDEQLDPDSPARIVWSLVCKLDLDAGVIRDVAAAIVEANQASSRPSLRNELLPGSARTFMPSRATRSMVTRFSARIVASMWAREVRRET